MIGETITQPCQEVRKSQFVRILDIILYGPFMVYAATTTKLTKNERIALSLLGFSTIVYNGNNFVKTLLKGEKR